MAAVTVEVRPARKVHGPKWAAQHPEQADDLWLVATAGGKRKRTRLGPPTPETWARAAEKQRDIERALRIATGGAAPLGIPTLAQAIETYLDSMRDHARSTRVTRRQQLPKFLPRLGDRRIDRVSPDDVLSWWAEYVVEGGRDYRTGMGHLEALSQVFEHAADLEGVAVENPVPAARRKLRRRAARTKSMRGRDERNRRPLTAEELRAFVPGLLRAKPDVVLLGLLLLDAGLRLGEAQGLRWCDVREGHLDVRQSIDMAGGASSPKSGLGRTVPLSRRLRALLQSFRAGRPHDPPQARILRRRRETCRAYLAEVS
jgi:integrase